MQRRAMLKLMGIMPAVTVLPSVTESARRSRSGKPTPDNVRDMEYLADRYQTLYHSTAPAALMTPVVAHLSTLGDLLRQDPEPAQRRRLLANRARVGTLAGRLSFFDLQDSMAARAYYSLALEAAREADDHLQAAAALAHVAFIPPQSTGSPPRWTTCMALAIISNPNHADRSRRGWRQWSPRCTPMLGTPLLPCMPSTGPATCWPLPGWLLSLPWFDYYDATRLHGFAGYATLRAERYDDARTELSTALGKLSRSAVKQRAVFLADLATVELRQGDVDHACKIASDAAHQLHQAGYATGAGRLRDLRAALEPWNTTTPVRVLDDQLAALN